MTTTTGAAPYAVGEMVWMHVLPRQFDHVVWVEERRYVDNPGEWLFDVWWIGQYQKIRARGVSETMLEKLGHDVEFPQNTQDQSRSRTTNTTPPR